MKAVLFVVALSISSVNSFSPLAVQRQATVVRSKDATTTLSLFGGKKKEAGGQKQPGMMDQLAMFKKAQEIAQKKGKLDKELQAMDIIGTAADGNIKITVKYVPAQLPTNPSPVYDAVSVDIDESYLESVSSADLSAALVDAIRDGETKAAQAVAQKYQTLDAELGAILGGMAGGSGNR